MILVLNISCKKYLDQIPDKSLRIPSTVKDLQALIDYNNLVNSFYPTMGEASSDDYYVSDDSYNSFTQEVQEVYTFLASNYTVFPNDWSGIYDVINVSNIVLDHGKRIVPDRSEQEQWNNVMGSAYFIRGSSLLAGSIVFCKAFDSSTANSDLGMVLRLHSDLNQLSIRANVAETYIQIIDDLKKSAALLPEIASHVERPCRAAAYGMLARTYLAMRIYDSCAHYSKMALDIKSDLLDYNEVDTNAYRPFNAYNSEVVYNKIAGQAAYYSISAVYARADSLLYANYGENDLRKRLFFNQQPDGYNFKGIYFSSIYDYFAGLTTGEIYLMYAESLAFLKDKEEALDKLNILLTKRFKSGTFEPFHASTASEALEIIRKERRKELVFRGLRWMDIKRLNKEGANITVAHKANGIIYKLTPNAPYFALPLPEDIIQMTGIPQNPK